MADGNLLSSIGIDIQLVTAGSAGGLVKALMGRQKVLDATASMIVGAMVSNYAGGPAATLLSGIEMFGLKMNLRPEVGGFFVGIFAYAIVAFVGSKLREKFGKEDAPK
jgi:hypothetical protein